MRSCCINNSLGYQSNTEFKYLLAEFATKYNKAITTFADLCLKDLKDITYFRKDTVKLIDPNLVKLFLYLYALSKYQIDRGGEVLDTSYLTTKEANEIFAEIERLTINPCSCN